MLFVLTVFFGFVLIFIGAVFSGWVYSAVYDFAITPLLSCLDVTAPSIPFMIFVLLSLGISACTCKASAEKESYTIKDVQFWSKWLGGIVTKLLTVAMLWITYLIVI